MKIIGHLVMVMLINGYCKYLIYRGVVMDGKLLVHRPIAYYIERKEELC